MSGCFTKKQFWRRQNTVTRHKHHDLVFLDGFDAENKINNPSRSLSEQFNLQGPRMVGNGKPWATTNNLLESKQDIYGNKLKSVMFSARVHVVLIPSISEYEAAGLAPAIWWNDDDYKVFKQSALNEVKDYMKDKNITDSKEAIKQLYQITESNNLPSEEVKSESDSTIQSSSVPSSSSSQSATNYNESLNSKPNISQIKPFNNSFSLNNPNILLEGNSDCLCSNLVNNPIHNSSDKIHTPNSISPLADQLHPLALLCSY